MSMRRLSPLFAFIFLAGCAGERSDQGSTFQLGLPHFAAPRFLQDKGGAYRGVLQKTVYAGRASQLWGDVSLTRDCEIAGETRLEVIAPPRHGAAEIKPGQLYAVYPEGDRHAACSGRLVDGVLALYTPAPGYLGVDQVVLRAAEAGGATREVTVDLTVAPAPPRPVRRTPVRTTPPILPPVEGPRPRQAPTDPDAPVPTAPQ